MPLRARHLFVFARDRMSCEMWAKGLIDKDSRYDNHKLVFLTHRSAISAMQGRRFERGDEIHYLNGFGMSEVARFIEMDIEIASLTWVPTKAYFDSQGNVLTYTQGHTPPPPMGDVEALEAWLAS